METLPKYVQNLNRIISRISEEPDQVWRKTQKDLAEDLDLAQPVISTMLKILNEHGKIGYGPSIPGVRGKNREIILVNADLFEGAPGRVTPRDQLDDRPLAPEEIVTGAIDLRLLTNEQIGAAIMRLLRRLWEKEEFSSQLRSDAGERIRELRERLEHERRNKVYVIQEKDRLERQLSELENQLTSMRMQLNHMMLQDRSNGYSIRELLDDEERQALDNLIREVPRTATA